MEPKYIVRDVFELVYSAFWLDEKINDWNVNHQQWDRLECQKVILKRLNNLIDGFLKEIELSV